MEVSVIEKFHQIFNRSAGDIVFWKEHLGREIYLQKEFANHPEISGNKLRKLYFPLKNYLNILPEHPLVISFGGAYSNHIAALAAAGQLLGIPTLGIIRGEELVDTALWSSTLQLAHEKGMKLLFWTRERFRLEKNDIQILQTQYPNSLIIPEGGTSPEGVEGIQMMLNHENQGFDYICTPVGSGGTMAGLLKFAEKPEKIIGFPVVRDSGLRSRIEQLSGVTLKAHQWLEADFGGYGKVSEEVLSFVRESYQNTGVPLDAVYTAKMMMRLQQAIGENKLPKGIKILAVHTGGLQGNRDLALPYR